MGVPVGLAVVYGCHGGLRGTVLMVKSRSQ